MTRTTVEYQRICALPRRVLTTEYARECAEFLTPQLRVRGSREALMPWQGASLVEAAQNDGAWLVLPVGVGKTHITYLLPRCMAAKRVAIIVPASLREKTRLDFAALFRDWGEIGCILKIISVQELAPEGGQDILDAFKPDLIIGDESHKLMNRMSSAARRIDRYKVASGCRVVMLTGTPSRKSIMGYWHILGWCLGEERMPLPKNEGEAEAWDAVLGMNAWGPAADPGCLGPSQKAARAWYLKRLVETPGVVIVDVDSAAGVPLTITFKIAPEDRALDEAYETFLLEQENPGGISVTDPLGRWRLDSQMGAGLYSRYKVPPPKPWVEARRESARFVRDTIEAHTWGPLPIDTEAQVFRRFPRAPEVENWKRIKPTFEPETEFVWLTNSTVSTAAAWLRESPKPSIVWVDTIEFGQALARATRLPYYGAQGENELGRSLRVADPYKSLIASWHACREGFNLQNWRRNLVVQVPQSALIWEQMMGRPHRNRQTEPVTFEVLITSGGSIDAFETAVLESKAVKEREGLTNKILRATIVRKDPVVSPANQFRWARRTKAKAPQTQTRPFGALRRK